MASLASHGQSEIGSIPPPGRVAEEERRSGEGKMDVRLSQHVLS
jgi:hypothetical protein